MYDRIFILKLKTKICNRKNPNLKPKTPTKIIQKESNTKKTPQKRKCKMKNKNLIDRSMY